MGIRDKAGSEKSKMAEKRSKLVIFDLDETLIHSSRTPLDRAPEIYLETLHVYVRPFAYELIDSIARTCEVAVWSAGSQVYVDTIVSAIFPPQVDPVFVWNRSHCTTQVDSHPFGLLFLKDLSKVEPLGFDLASTIIIEDDPVKIRDYKRHALIVNQYFGEHGDTELEDLVKYMERVCSADDMLKHVKDRWRNDLKRKFFARNLLRRGMV